MVRMPLEKMPPPSVEDQPFEAQLATVTPRRLNVPLLRTAPPSNLPTPPDNVRLLSASEAPAATSNRRNSGVPRAVLRWMLSPLPRIVRLSPAAITGRPVGPSVLLPTELRVKVVPAARLVGVDPPPA